MKTLQDLVDGLNDVFSKAGHFYLFYDDEMETIYLSRKLSDVCFELAEISKKYKSWLVGKDLYMQVGEVQKVIMNFLANSNPEDWFAEKKYNIVLNNLEGEKIVINKYDRHSTLAIECSTGIDDDELKLDAYIFTEKEIEQLKLILPTNMAKIVDLGKVEVKDD